MNSTIKFNKQILDLHSKIIQEFIDKLKLNIPEDCHPLVDEQFKKETDIIKLNIKNINKINTKINNKIKNKDAPKKPAKANCWRLFCAYKSKEFTNVSQNEKWTLCTPFWNELKLTGGDKYWRDLADEHNSKITDSLSDTSDNTHADEEEVEQPIKATPSKTAKATPKAKKAATKKAAPKPKEDTDEDDSDNDKDKEDDEYS